MTPAITSLYPASGITPLQRTANLLAFATSASVLGGAPTTFSVTYTIDNGPSDIAGGTVKLCKQLHDRYKIRRVDVRERHDQGLDL